MSENKFCSNVLSHCHKVNVALINITIFIYIEYNVLITGVVIVYAFILKSDLVWRVKSFFFFKTEDPIKQNEKALPLFSNAAGDEILSVFWNHVIKNICM